METINIDYEHKIVGFNIDGVSEKIDRHVKPEYLLNDRKHKVCVLFNNQNSPVFKSFKRIDGWKFGSDNDLKGILKYVFDRWFSDYNFCVNFIPRRSNYRNVLDNLISTDKYIQWARGGGIITDIETYEFDYHTDYNEDIFISECNKLGITEFDGWKICDKYFYQMKLKNNNVFSFKFLPKKYVNLMTNPFIFSDLPKEINHHNVITINESMNAGNLLSINDVKLIETYIPKKLINIYLTY